MPTDQELGLGTRHFTAWTGFYLVIDCNSGTYYTNVYYFSISMSWSATHLSLEEAVNLGMGFRARNPSKLYTIPPAPLHGLI